MKRIMIALLVLVFVGTVTQDATAQRRGKKKRPAKEQPTNADDNETGSKREGTTRDYREEDFGGSVWDDVNIEIKPGNLFIGSTTILSLKSNIGYNFNKTFSAGVGSKLFYLWSDQGTQGSTSVFNYGGLVYARAKITRELYLVGEYNLGRANEFNSEPRVNLSYAAAGIGYMTPGIDWSSGFELLIIFDNVARSRLFSPIEYWINFSHNF